MSMSETGLRFNPEAFDPPSQPDVPDQSLPTIVLRCTSCRQRYGWPSFLEDDEWTVMPWPRAYFGDVTFRDVMCPECARTQ